MIQAVINAITGKGDEKGLGISPKLEHAIEGQRDALKYELESDPMFLEEVGLVTRINNMDLALSAISARREGQKPDETQDSALRAIVKEFRKMQSEGNL